MRSYTFKELMRVIKPHGSYNFEKEFTIRKLYPFHDDIRCRTHLTQDCAQQIAGRYLYKEPLNPGCCGCGESLIYTNGFIEEYTATLVVWNDNKFSLCCYHCIPKKSIEYRFQVHGHRRPMKLPDIFSSDSAFVETVLTWEYILSDENKYELLNCKTELTSRLKSAIKRKVSSEYWGCYRGTHSVDTHRGKVRYKLSNETKKIVPYGKQGEKRCEYHYETYKEGLITVAQAIGIVEMILKEYHRTTEPEINQSRQLTLF